VKKAVEEYEKEYGKKGRRIKEKWKEMPGKFMAKLLYG